MWTLLLARATDPPGTFIDRRQLDAGQIKVGRSAKTCDWVLPDEHGHISREHCTISALGLDLFVIDTSTNGVALNRPDGRIAPQLPVAIRANDRLLIGDFVITVATEAAGAGMALMPAPP
ncbi:FHA domain-containing protein, partial [Sphingomonas sp. CCH20-B6]